MKEELKIIEKLIIKLGYKKGGKDVLKQQQFQKGNIILSLGTFRLSKEDKETFKQKSNRIFSK